MTVPLPAETREWLKRAPEPYIGYAVDRLLDPATADPATLDDDPFIQENLEAVKGWKGDVLTRHDKADLVIHRLSMLADIWG